MAEQSTQQLVEVADIKEEIVILKNGSMRSLVEVSSINFELRSEEEQTAILQNFQRFLNSVDFQMQIIMSSRKIFIDDYLKYVKDQSENLDELLKIQAAEYSRFIEELAGLSNIMSKRFYIVIPFFAYENAQAVGIKQSIKSIFRTSSQVSQMDPEKFNTYRNQILQRAELVLDGLIALGLKAKVLGEKELIDIFYNLYNPGLNLKTKIDNAE